LSFKAKVFFYLIVVAQVIISALDLVGLALIMKILLGFQGASEGSSSTNSAVIPIFGKFFSSVSSSTLLMSIVIIFIFKGLAALYLHTLTVKLMTSETLKLVEKLTNTIFMNRTRLYKDLTSQDISFTITNATELVFRDTLVPVSIVIADAALLALIAGNLFFSAQVLFLPTTLYFITVFTVLRMIEKRSTQQSYKVQWENEILVRSLIQETALSLRELYVSSKLSWMTSRVFQARSTGLRAGSSITIGQLRPKYFYEMALFGGIGVIAFVSNYSGNSKQILTYLTLFIISSSRMIPSLLRIQYYLGIFQKSQVQTTEIFEVLDLVSTNLLNETASEIELPRDKVEQDEKKLISLKNVTFSYELGGKPAQIENISLDIARGETVAFVGPSGAGKSTLVDLILGYQDPTSGSVLMAGLPPRVRYLETPGNVAYVPQKVTIYEGSLLSNVAVGIIDESDLDSRSRVQYLLECVGLGDFLQNSKAGLETRLSELGSSLSGGQVQRIGIARALFTDPEILVFDESTSSLDSASEEFIMQFLLSFKGQKTLLFIAHRLSTIRTSDRILYLHNGRIEAEGNFETLQDMVPEFKKQVSYLNVNSQVAKGKLEE
jgi:ATP-binding cassette subfamily C protein